LTVVVLADKHRLAAKDRKIRVDNPKKQAVGGGVRYGELGGSCGGAIRDPEIRKLVFIVAFKQDISPQ